MDTSFFSDPAFYLLIAFIVPLILRVPIAVALGLSALGVAWYWDMGTDMLSYNFFAGIAKVPLLAIPFLFWQATSWSVPGLPQGSCVLLRAW